MASVHGLARQLGTMWRTVSRAIRPLLQAMADAPARFDVVSTLGVVSVQPEVAPLEP